MIAMKRVLIVRYGEISLKGLNRPYFEKTLLRNIKNSLKNIGDVSVYLESGRIYIDRDSQDTEDCEEIIDKVKKVFGVVSVSPAVIVGSKIEEICNSAKNLLEEILEIKDLQSFKVEASRTNKNFPYKSPDINRIIGSYILENFKELKVDVHNPDIILNVEVKDKTYIFTEKVDGFGGLPYGTGGKAMLLISGGIDSPVAGWLMAKRGVEIEAVHFHSYPFTSQRALEKVLDLVRILSSYCNERITLFSVNLLEIQKAINEKCPPEELTIISRRFMMRIAEKIALERNCGALITGESLGQVASQTLEGLNVTNSAVNVPVFRPLIAMDKLDIVRIAKQINTYETSIQPYEDCCTVFMPKNPVTKPKLDKILKSESLLDSEGLIERAINGIEKMVIKPR